MLILSVLEGVLSLLNKTKNWLNDHLTVRHYLFLGVLVCLGFLGGNCERQYNIQRHSGLSSGRQWDTLLVEPAVRDGGGGGPHLTSRLPNVHVHLTERTTSLLRRVKGATSGVGNVARSIEGMVARQALSGIISTNEDGHRNYSKLYSKLPNALYNESETYHGWTQNLGIEAGAPKGAGIDCQFYQFRDLESHAGVDYFFTSQHVSPAIGIGWNPQKITRVTHNTYLFLNWVPLGPNGVSAVFGGIRLNL